MFSDTGIHRLEDLYISTNNSSTLDPGSNIPLECSNIDWLAVCPIFSCLLNGTTVVSLSRDCPVAQEFLESDRVGIYLFPIPPLRRTQQEWPRGAVIVSSLFATNRLKTHISFKFQIILASRLTIHKMSQIVPLHSSDSICLLTLSIWFLYTCLRVTHLIFGLWRHLLKTI